jgi:hypothetical protein
MKVAIILTGALRTIKRTILYTKEMLVRPNANCELFLCIQNDTKESNDDWLEWFKEQLGSKLISVIWFSKDAYPDWLVQREILLNHMAIDGPWKNYLRNSGSIIEYYQLQLAYMEMCFKEQLTGYTYDYIIRTRTDSIYTKPVDFHWLSWTEHEVDQRILRIKKELVDSGLDTGYISVLKYFMCTILSDDVIPNIPYIIAQCDHSEQDCMLDKQELTGAFLSEYIKKGRYILTLRQNNLYIVNRSFFNFIPSLGTMYGMFRSKIEDAYWFNAENQFRSACYHSGLTIFNYTSHFEEKSLSYDASWIEADFFDLEFKCVNPRMLYCVVRK